MATTFFSYGDHTLFLWQPHSFSTAKHYFSMATTSFFYSDQIVFSMATIVHLKVALKVTFLNRELRVIYRGSGYAAGKRLMQVVQNYGQTIMKNVNLE